MKKTAAAADDFNDREVAEFGAPINYFPRGNITAILEIVDFDEYEDEESGKRGYSLKVIVREAKRVGKPSEYEDALPEVDDEDSPYAIPFTYAGIPKKMDFVRIQNKQNWRKVCAAMMREVHTPDTDVNKFTRLLIAAKDSGKFPQLCAKLPLIELRRRGELSGLVEREGEDPRRYFNVKTDTYTAIDD